jgi:hypothetical protein
MAAEARADDNEEFDTPHLPERYHQTVKAKKRQRLKKHIMMACAAVLIITLMYLLLSWVAGGLFSSISAQSPGLATGSMQSPETASGTPLSNSSENSTPSFRQGAGLNPPLPPGVIALDAAVAACRTGYPAADFTITGADLARSPGHPLYKFEIRPSTGSGTASTIFLDATTGLFYSPGEETAVIPRDDAEQRARAAFPSPAPDRCLLTFTTSDNGQKLWKYSLYKGSSITATGTMDADSGEMIAYTEAIPPASRPAVPTLTAVQAQGIAERYIIDQNAGQLPLTLSNSWYEPVASPSGSVAGQYGYVYVRTFQDIPADVDGFTVMVDGVSGEVVGYSRQWTTPEYAFSAATQPDIVRREATFAVLQKAKEKFPDTIGGLQIVSADMRWMNNVPYGTVPRPGSVPLAWKVVFDDEIIRANTSAQPAVAWVDGQSGEFLAFEYEH